MGRTVANENFLRALLKANPYDRYHFYLAGPDQLAAVQGRLKDEFPQLAVHCGLWSDLPAALRTTRFSVFHLSDWIVGYVPLAALRNRYAGHIFPITGVIHSLSYARYHSEFLQHIWPGCTARDAIVVTSAAGEAVVGEAFQQLRANYRLPENFVQPELVRIPLGTADLPAPAHIAALRRQKREALGLNADDVLLLYIGRISHSSKKDMLPLLRALSRAGREGTDLNRVRLVLAGWIDSGDKIADHLAVFAGALGINLTVVPRPDNAARAALYAAADIFVSLVDNLQETFGITLLEAASYGLPVIASDFDGYRDLVIDGETGLLVPSLGPRRTEACDLLAHFWNDSRFHLFFAQESVVNVAQAARCLARLIAAPDLRRRMGCCGRERVAAGFTWSKLIPRYVRMWEQLANRPLPAAPPGSAHPLYLSYGRLFGKHFSAQLHDALPVVWSRSGEALYRGRENPVLYEGMESWLPLDRLKELMFLARRPTSAGALSAALQAAGLDGEQADYLVLWALKHDFLEVVE